MRRKRNIGNGVHGVHATSAKRKVVSPGDIFRSELAGFGNIFNIEQPAVIENPTSKHSIMPHIVKDGIIFCLSIVAIQFKCYVDRKVNTTATYTRSNVTKTQNRQQINAHKTKHTVHGPLIT